MSKFWGSNVQPNTLIVVNNVVPYVWKLLTESILNVLRTKKKKKLFWKSDGSSCGGSVEINSTSMYEDAGSIPGLPQVG